MLASFKRNNNSETFVYGVDFKYITTKKWLENNSHKIQRDKTEQQGNSEHYKMMTQQGNAMGSIVLRSIATAGNRKCT